MDLAQTYRTARIAPNYGTAMLAQSFGVIALTVSSPSQSESCLIALLRPQPAVEERKPLLRVLVETPPRTSTEASVSTVIDTPTAIKIEALSGAGRETTLKEHMIGELRGWKLLAANWDGENADAPIAESIDDAVAFARLLDVDSTAEPMLHANGRAGLFWNDENLYADIEFLGSRKIAYYIESNGDKHKGVVNFATEMPAVFEAVLPT